MANFPTSTPSFTTKNNGDTIQPGHINSLQEEVVAIGSSLGSLGSPFASAIGTWTPVLGGSGGTSGQSYSVQTGTYFKIGRLVLCTFFASLSAKGTITTSLQLQGLPFTISSGNGYRGGFAVNFENMATNHVNVMLELNDNATVASVYGKTSASASNRSSLTTSDVANNTILTGSLWYIAAS